jgi:hypothetical protein
LNISLSVEICGWQWPAEPPWYLPSFLSILVLLAFNLSRCFKGQTPTASERVREGELWELCFWISWANWSNNELVYGGSKQAELLTVAVSHFIFSESSLAVCHFSLLVFVHEIELWPHGAQQRIVARFLFWWSMEICSFLVTRKREAWVSPTVCYLGFLLIWLENSIEPTWCIKEKQWRWIKMMMILVS